MVLIGALGFVPFFTAAAYFANAVEAYRDAAPGGWWAEARGLGWF